MNKPLPLDLDGITTAPCEIPHGMRPGETQILGKLIEHFRCKEVLEIGLANGTSTVAMLEAVSRMGGRVTSIDPFQVQNTDKTDYYNINGAGLERVRQSGFGQSHEFVNNYDYIALPDLVREGRRFDFIFIDGYHSFDYTLLDLFYADLLLRDGGIVALHDTSSRTVYKAVDYFMKNKPYRPIGARPVPFTGTVIHRGIRRVATILKGQNAEYKQRRYKWFTLAAFQKTKSGISPEFSLVDF